MLNWERARKLMARDGLDALVATCPENVFYVSGFKGFGHTLLRDVQLYALIPFGEKAEVKIVAPKGELDLAAECGITAEQVIPFGSLHVHIQDNLGGAQAEFARMVQKVSFVSPEEALAQGVRELGLEDSVVGIDESNISPYVWDRLSKMFPHMKMVRARKIFNSIRMIKNREEIERLRRAAEITQSACEEALQQAREGMTEIEMAQVFEKALVERGAKPCFTVLGFGERSALLNVQPTERKLKVGDIIRFDIGCVYDHYYSDIARIAVFGKIRDERIPVYYRAVREGEEKALDMIKPGVLASEVFRVAVEGVRSAGIPHFERHHCGHGIGLEVYDPPVIGPTNDTVLEEGMVLCIETPYYELGFGGFQVEDTIVVTKDGCELFTQAPKDLVVIEG